MKDTTKILDQVNDMLAGILEANETTLASRDFDEVLNTYIKFNSLWHHLNENVNAKLEFIGNFISNEYQKALDKDNSEIVEKVEENCEIEDEEVDINSNKYYLNVNSIRMLLKELGVEGSPIKEDSSGYSFCALGCKVCSNPGVNFHGDHSQSILVLRKNQGKTVAKVFASVEDATHYVMLHKGGNNGR